ncbi:nucleoside recognition family protein [Kosakonia cowanii]|jgi:spore maturation protein SpmB|uniref:nucleoside recognition domain-containing protein n=1 Tax=Kosakonia cowanii TaxID=208223 RepID=UPI001123D06F|nr:nucleoside recognition domain-containing protein [Kosakonia cowanii]MDM9617150.1 nucleoside recognition domain-containing protein [Kosakonia cowanii]MDP4562217.1 nucleoside recognition domain-containing protein [Kosakonia cowanii]TPD66331.1 nucleoside recognition family protein [Kosakonia cowanii]TPD89868.1 nucleoside recognition family protein [Kosakonia cowanii]TPE06240.1 nucleoside recognition family protein [Kosakonia cowanii]
MNIIEIIMSAGRVSVDVALYTLLPIMVVMLIIMKYLEEKGVLDAIVRLTSPALKPFGISGMGIFALIQLNFVSFAAPLAALAIMERRGTSDRHLAATLAMVFAMGQANVFYPLTPFGLHWGAAIGISLIGGLAASSFTYYLAGRRLSSATLRDEEGDLAQEKPRAGLIAVINGAGADAIRLSLGSLPMLLLSLTVVGILKAAGVVEALTSLLTPLMSFFHISTVYVLLTLTKCLAGGTAYFGVASEMAQHGQLTAAQINASAGFLVQTLDLPGIGIFLGIASRFVRLFRFALAGAIVGILLRTLLHAMLF